MALKQFNVAVDIGGTFTDLLAFDEETGRLFQAKCLSTPPDFATGVLDGVRKAMLDLKHVESFVHGSTVAINTAIERTGARTALIVTRGTRDVYQIARGNRRILQYPISACRAACVGAAHFRSRSTHDRLGRRASFRSTKRRRAMWPNRCSPKTLTRSPSAFCIPIGIQEMRSGWAIFCASSLPRSSSPCRTK